METLSMKDMILAPTKHLQDAIQDQKELTRTLDSNEKLYIESPDKMAAWHYREDNFRNPFAAGCDSYLEYEQAKAKILSIEKSTSRF
jgi:hypothetical protein